MGMDRDWQRRVTVGISFPALRCWGKDWVSWGTWGILQGGGNQRKGVRWTAAATAGAEEDDQEGVAAVAPDEGQHQGHLGMRGRGTKSRVSVMSYLKR